MGPLRRQNSPLTRNSVLQIISGQGRVTHANYKKATTTPLQATRLHDRLEVQLHSFLTSALVGQWSSSRPSRNPATNSIRGCLAPTVTMDLFEKQNISRPARNRATITGLSSPQLSHTKDHDTPGPVKRKGKTN